ARERGAGDRGRIRRRRAHAGPARTRHQHPVDCSHRDRGAPDRSAGVPPPRRKVRAGPMNQTAIRPSIIVDGVRKTFTLNHAFSLEGAVVSWIRRRKLSSAFEALKGIDLVSGEGESVAILGLNGSGKSTLLKLISGVMEPDAGEVLTRGRVAGLIE